VNFVRRQDRLTPRGTLVGRDHREPTQRDRRRPKRDADDQERERSEVPAPPPVDEIARSRPWAQQKLSDQRQQASVDVHQCVEQIVGDLVQRDSPRDPFLPTRTAIRCQCLNMAGLRHTVNGNLQLRAAGSRFVRARETMSDVGHGLHLHA
jgi:hypothetical protein